MLTPSEARAQARASQAARPHSKTKRLHAILNA